MALAATGGRCRVVAFEPSFSSFAALCANFELNRWSDRAIPLQVALAEHTGLVHLHYSSPAAGSALHHIEDAGGSDDHGSGVRQTVAGYRLDQLVEELDLPLPNLLKIDVDGAELATLRRVPGSCSNTLVCARS